MTHTPSQINWREWTPQTFDQARREDKPILLDIGAVWCHWCHVMDTGIDNDPDHTGTYAEPAVQERINASFIAVKVDTDKQPDINARYNMGGWPSTVFLTPDGETLYGETYVPPLRMVALLDHIATLWRERRDEIAAQMDSRASSLRDQADAESSQTAGDVDPQTVPQVLASLHTSWDSAYGGLVTNLQCAPKFPHPSALHLALEQYALAPDAQLKELLVSTLRGMSGGGMYDQYAGGVFRYSTTRDWSVPHYEKMLEDNAKLSCVYLRAAHALGREEFRETAVHVTDWLLGTLRDPATGAFAGSQDADAEAAYYGKPLAVRASLPTPYIDRTAYANWNALAVSALVCRFQSTREPHILDAARAAFSFLAARLLTPDPDANSDAALRHYFADGQAQGAVGLLDDQTAFLNAALDLYEIAADPPSKQYALQAAHYILQHLQNTEQGGFHDLRPDAQAVGEMARPRRDMDANAHVSLALLRLHALTGNSEYHAAAARALRLFASEYRAQSFFAASYARAVDALLRPALHIVLVGTADAPDLLEMQTLAWQTVHPAKSVETLAPGDAAARGFPPSEGGTARAYVCLGETCRLAATPPDLASLLGPSV